LADATLGTAPMDGDGSPEAAGDEDPVGAEDMAEGSVEVEPTSPEKNGTAQHMGPIAHMP
jgi:hypothetical protein